MNPVAKDPTLDVPREVWRQYQEWAATARRRKQIETKARNAALALGLLGAVLGALTGYLEPDVARGVGVTAALAVALAGFVGREFLVTQGEPDWTRARILAEALKRETWLYLMNVPPYDAPDRDQKLLAAAVGFEENLGLRRIAVPAASQRPFPQAVSLDDYVRERLDDQIRYYEKAWVAGAKTLGRWRPITLALGAAALILGLDVFTGSRLPTWIPVVTTLGAAIAAYLRALQLETLISVYQGAEHQLRLKSAAAAKAAADPVAFVRDCEEIMKRENQSWRAEWSRRPEDQK